MKILKTRNFVASLIAALFTLPVCVLPAFGEVNANTPDFYIQKIEDLFITIGMPLGAVLLVGSLILVAIKFMTSGGDAGKRASAIEGLFSSAVGGIILGAVLFFAGFLIGVGKWLAQ